MEIAIWIELGQGGAMKVYLAAAAAFLTGLFPSVADEAAEALVLSTYKITAEGSTATALAIELPEGKGDTRRVLMTADHVVSKMKGDACRMVSRELEDKGTYRRREIEIPIRKEGKDLWKKHPAHDLVMLPIPDSVEIRALPFDCLATEEAFAGIRVGDDVRLAVFPEQVESNGAGLPVLRGGSIASFPLVPVALHSTILIDAITWSGDSGGPVIDASRRSPSGGPLVIGVVIRKREISETIRESRYVEKKITYPLNLSEVVNAALVREILEEKKPASG